MYTLLLSSRYLRTRFIALASIISMTLGVATMIVVNSVMKGFSTEMRVRIHGLLADVVVEAVNKGGEPDVDEHLNRIDSAAGEFIEAMTPTVEMYGMMHYTYLGTPVTQLVTIIGIDPRSKARVGTFTDHLGRYRPMVDEYGEVTDPPERDMSSPPDFELSVAAMDYRRRRTEQQALLRRHRHIRGIDEVEAGGDRENDAVVAPMNADAANGGNESVLQADLRNPPGSDDPAHAEAADDPFKIADLDERANATASPIDPAAPLRARVIVGKGLITYSDIDKETGKLRTAWTVLPGDDVTFSTVTGGDPPNPVRFSATVVDTFQSGMSEYDQTLVFVNIEEFQRIRGMISRPFPNDPKREVRSLTSVQIRLKDYKHAPIVVERLKQAFPPYKYTIRTWEDKQGPLLAAVDIEAGILNVLLFLIIAVAGFGILAIFYMIVVEKTRDIGILKSLGASSTGVMTIFLTYGLSLGAVGSGAGVVLGMLFVWNINTIESWLTWCIGHKVFDQRIYYFPTIPTHTEPLMVVWVAAGAMGIAVLASVLPARYAAMMHPVQALRSE
jgi:lipoprotein-releasing system permease protein